MDDLLGHGLHQDDVTERLFSVITRLRLDCKMSLKHVHTKNDLRDKKKDNGGLVRVPSNSNMPRADLMKKNLLCSVNLHQK